MISFESKFFDFRRHLETKSFPFSRLSYEHPKNTQNSAIASKCLKILQCSCKKDYFPSENVYQSLFTSYFSSIINDDINQVKDFTLKDIWTVILQDISFYFPLLTFIATTEKIELSPKNHLSSLLDFMSIQQHNLETKSHLSGLKLFDNEIPVPALVVEDIFHSETNIEKVHWSLWLTSQKDSNFNPLVRHKISSLHLLIETPRDGSYSCFFNSFLSSSSSSSSDSLVLSLQQSPIQPSQHFSNRSSSSSSSLQMNLWNPSNENLESKEDEEDEVEVYQQPADFGCWINFFLETTQFTTQQNYTSKDYSICEFELELTLDDNEMSLCSRKIGKNLRYFPMMLKSNVGLNVLSSFNLPSCQSTVSALSLIFQSNCNLLNRLLSIPNSLIYFPSPQNSSQQKQHQNTLTNENNETFPIQITRLFGKLPTDLFLKLIDDEDNSSSCNSTFYQSKTSSVDYFTIKYSPRNPIEEPTVISLIEVSDSPKPQEIEVVTQEQSQKSQETEEQVPVEEYEQQMEQEVEQEVEQEQEPAIPENNESHLEIVVLPENQSDEKFKSPSIPNSNFHSNLQKTLQSLSSLKQPQTQSYSGKKEENINSIIDTYFQLQGLTATTSSIIKQQQNQLLNSQHLPTLSPPHPPHPPPQQQSPQMKITSRDLNDIKLTSSPKPPILSLKPSSENSPNLINKPNQMEGLDILISEDLLMNNPLYATLLLQKYKIRCLDAPLEYPLSFILDEVTGVCLLTTATLRQSKDNLKQFVKKLTSIVFKFNIIWLIILSSSADGENDIVQIPPDIYGMLYQSFTQFPCSVEIRFASHLSLPSLIHSFCEDAAEWSTTKKDILLSTFKERSMFNHLSSYIFSAHCEFLQLFPSINFFLAVRLLSIWELKDLVNVDIAEMRRNIQNRPLLSIERLHSSLHLLLNISSNSSSSSS